MGILKPFRDVAQGEGSGSVRLRSSTGPRRPRSPRRDAAPRFQSATGDGSLVSDKNHARWANLCLVPGDSMAFSVESGLFGALDDGFPEGGAGGHPEVGLNPGGGLFQEDGAAGSGRVFIGNGLVETFQELFLNCFPLWSQELQGSGRIAENLYRFDAGQVVEEPATGRKES